MLVNVRLLYILVDVYHNSSYGQMIFTVSLLAWLHFRPLFFNLFWFAAPLRSVKNFGGTPNWLKMTILQYLMQ